VIFPFCWKSTCFFIPSLLNEYGRLEDWFTSGHWLSPLQLTFPRGCGGRKAKRVVLSIGRLQSIDLDVLDFALRELLKQFGVDVGEIEYRISEAELECRVCGYRWKLLPKELESDVSEMIHFIPEPSTPSHPVRSAALGTTKWSAGEGFT